MGVPGYRILAVDDDSTVRLMMEAILGKQYALRTVDSVSQARKFIAEERPHLMLLDLGLPGESGMDFLKEVRKSQQGLEVVVVTGNVEIDTAVTVMKLGARDYLNKPFSRGDLLLAVKQAHDEWRLRDNVARLEDELYAPFAFASIVSASQAMGEVIRTASKMARSDVNVLITGESGVGKELVARAIHSEGDRRHGPFVCVNCAQFSDALLTSELFGHEKGAFTGATAQRRGRFELAEGGSLFLDEVGNTSMEMQTKILRAVETGEFERVGGEETVKTDVRLISATNSNLPAEIENGSFREDLYYRLNVVHIEVPPLRVRREDIEPLCRHFLEEYRKKTGKPVEDITPEAMKALKAYHWPGNVRQLQNIVQMALALEDDARITTRYLPPYVMDAKIRKQVGETTRGGSLHKLVSEYERTVLIEQLRLTNWNFSKTARQLGIHRNTMNSKIDKHNLREEKAASE